MKHNFRVLTTGVTASLCLLLAACGGGGGSASGTAASSTTSSSTPTNNSSTIPAGTTFSSSQYSTSSVQAGMFDKINAYRTTCGFPALSENTILDQAATNHANYIVDNGVVTDSETQQGTKGFTGQNGQAQADAAGWPTGVFATNMSAETNNTNPSDYMLGEQIVNDWAAGVYHQNGIISATTVAGFGDATTTVKTTSGSMEMYAATINMGGTDPNVTRSNGPLTFPCDTISGVPYGVPVGGEDVMPPNISASGFGTPVTVEGNLNDTVNLTTATMTSMTDGTTINLAILNHSTDPNNYIGTFESVAYPTSPLLPNTTYQVNLSGTYNGKAFSRSFSFTTGSSMA